MSRSQTKNEKNKRRATPFANFIPLSKVAWGDMLRWCTFIRRFSSAGRWFSHWTRSRRRPRAAAVPLFEGPWSGRVWRNFLKTRGGSYADPISPNSSLIVPFFDVTADGVTLFEVVVESKTTEIGRMGGGEGLSGTNNFHKSIEPGH